MSDCCTEYIIFKIILSSYLLNANAKNGTHRFESRNADPENGTFLSSREYVDSETQIPYSTSNNQISGSVVYSQPYPINHKYDLLNAPYAFHYDEYHYTRPPFVPAESLYRGDLLHFPIPTVSSSACLSSTFRTKLGCYCRLTGKRCSADFSVCTPDEFGDGYCKCVTGYVQLDLRCVTPAQYNNSQASINGGTTSLSIRSFKIFTPLITASCFLPINGVIGNVESSGGNGTLIYTFSLLSSSPLGDTVKHVDIEPFTGNLLYKSIAPASVTNQLYSLTAKDSKGNTTTSNFTVYYNCTAPSCSFDFGNSLIVDCLRFTTGDTIVTFQVTGSVAPTVFSTSLINSSSRNGNTFFRISSTTGQVFLQKIPHNGVFVENYSVSATNAAGSSCTPQTLTLTTTETCV